MGYEEIEKQLSRLDMKIGYCLSHLCVVSAKEGFITSYHLNELVREGWDIVGFDGMLAYVKKP